MPDRSVADPFLRLVEIMARLRGPGGCPWDREQTPESLRPYVIEEAYEVLEAIECGDPDALRDELGDPLLQVGFQAELAAAAGDLGDVRLTLTSLARPLDAPAEMALRDAAARFVVRARRADAAARARGAALVDLGPDERDRLWTLAKQEDDAGSV